MSELPDVGHGADIPENHTVPAPRPVQRPRAFPLTAPPSDGSRFINDPDKGPKPSHHMQAALHWMKKHDSPKVEAALTNASPTVREQAELASKRDSVSSAAFIRSSSGQAVSNSAHDIAESKHEWGSRGIQDVRIDRGTSDRVRTTNLDPPLVRGPANPQGPGLNR